MDRSGTECGRCFIDTGRRPRRCTRLGIICWIRVNSLNRRCVRGARVELAERTVNLCKRERSWLESISKVSHTLSNEKGWVVRGALTHCAASAKLWRLRALPVPFQLRRTLIASTSTASIRRRSPDCVLGPIIAKYCEGIMISACERISSAIDPESFIFSFIILPT
jgi:hypothetical protein